MIRVRLIEQRPDGTEEQIPLDAGDGESVELARQLTGREMTLGEVIAAIRNVASMYGKQSKISVRKSA